MLAPNPRFDEFRKARRQDGAARGSHPRHEYLLGSPQQRLLRSPEFTRGYIAGVGSAMIQQDPKSRTFVLCLVLALLALFDEALEQSIRDDWYSEPNFGDMGHDQ